MTLGGQTSHQSPLNHPAAAAAAKPQDNKQWHSKAQDNLNPDSRPITERKPREHKNRAHSATHRKHQRSDQDTEPRGQSKILGDVSNRKKSNSRLRNDAQGEAAHRQQKGRNRPKQLEQQKSWTSENNFCRIRHSDCRTLSCICLTPLLTQPDCFLTFPHNQDHQWAAQSNKLGTSCAVRARA
jgi:hypothetical protein